MTATETPREIDTQLAAIWHQIHNAEHRVSLAESTLKHYAGAKYYYRGRQRVTDMTVEQAIEILEAELVKLAEYKSTHSTTEADGWVRVDWREYSGRVQPYDADKLAPAIAELDERLAVVADLHNAAAALELKYEGWSRFFLVTSSAGHVHSSTHCSTCRPTTRFGWLPELSGKSETDAVGELGPTLCSVCFPSAPVEYTLGKKLTAAQAAKKAA